MITVAAVVVVVVAAAVVAEGDVVVIDIDIMVVAVVGVVAADILATAWLSVWVTSGLALRLLAGLGGGGRLITVPVDDCGVCVGEGRPLDNGLNKILRGKVCSGGTGRCSPDRRRLRRFREEEISNGKADSRSSPPLLVMPRIVCRRENRFCWVGVAFATLSDSGLVLPEVEGSAACGGLGIW